MKKILLFIFFFNFLFCCDSWSQNKTSPLTFVIDKINKIKSGDLQYVVKEKRRWEPDTTTITCTVQFWKDYVGNYAFILHASNGTTFIHDLQSTYTIPKSGNRMYESQNKYPL